MIIKVMKVEVVEGYMGSQNTNGYKENRGIFYQKCKKYHKTQDGRNFHDWADYAWIQGIFSKSQLAPDAKLGKLEGTAVTDFREELLYHLKKDVCGIKFPLYYSPFQYIGQMMYI